MFRTHSKAVRTDAAVDDFIYAPVFAAGRVLVASMLDSILFQTFHNSSILNIFKLMCGVRYLRNVELDKHLGVDPSYLCLIGVPPEYMGQTFASLYRELALNQGIVPIGLLRDTDFTGAGNKLPFVFTNPPASLLLRESDLVYVLFTSVTSTER
ncbi:hypothetical protein HK104_008212 [Borealophlyctis nickersoniae]|nr:hypothetical protein HK104_008212 [Borealophlyctis nickersoniae]